MITTFYLIRHGTTRANKENRFAGRTAEPLHAEGAEHIRGLAGKLVSRGISRVYCGPLPRTVQSAEIVGDACHAPMTVADGLIDMHIPHWDGLTKQEIRDLHGDEYPSWLAAPQNFSLPRCESLADVRERAVAVIEKLIDKHAGESLAVISHLIVLRCLVLHYQKLPLADFRSVKIENGDVVRVRISHNPGGRGVEVRFLHD